MRAKPLTFRRARSLRQNMTLPEGVLWQCLRGRKLNGLFFRRQHAIGPYILDFYCASARLAVEIDGAVHEQASQAAHDERRTAWLAKQRVHTLRFAAADVLKDERLEFVLGTIAEAAAPSGSPLRGDPPPPLCGGGTLGHNSSL